MSGGTKTGGFASTRAKLEQSVRDATQRQLTVQRANRGRDRVFAGENVDVQATRRSYALRSRGVG